MFGHFVLWTMFRIGLQTGLPRGLAFILIHKSHISVLFDVDVL